MIDYESDPKFWQRFLKCGGFYTALIDGDFGPKSYQAVHDFEQQSIEIANQLGAVDGRSGGNIQSLLPAAQREARAFMKAVKAKNITIKVISGTRTFAEQDRIYRQGRSLPGDIVTNARGGQSNHNFGVAWDIGVWVGGQYQPESPLYKKVGAIGKSLGLVWGGDWTRFRDRPHFQIVKESDLDEIGAKFLRGEPFV